MAFCDEQDEMILDIDIEESEVAISGGEDMLVLEEGPDIVILNTTSLEGDETSEEEGKKTCCTSSLISHDVGISSVHRDISRLS